MNTNPNRSVVNSVSVAMASYLTLKTLNLVSNNSDLLSSPVPANADKMQSSKVIADIVANSVFSAITKGSVE